MQKRQKIKIISIFITILVLLLGTYILLKPKLAEKTSLPIVESPSTDGLKINEVIKNETGTQIEEKDQATLEISGLQYKAQIAENTSVYNFMKNFRDNGQVDFKDKTFIGMGKFIEEINGVRGNGSEFWIYYVNGKKATIGVSNYKINPGDVVSWKYEKDIN